jgi:hypothetical protein
MAIALHSWKKDADGKIRVRHTFYAATEKEAERLMHAHGDGCEAFGPALDAGETIDITEEIEQLPTVEMLDDWGEEGLPDAEGEDDADDEEEDEEG